MEDISIIGLDLAKNSFQLHGASADGAVVFRKKLSRSQVLKFLAAHPRCIVAMEACANAHHWGRAFGELGHDVRLIAPIYAKPFVKRQKNDAADAEAICEAAQRPTMRFVAVKSDDKQSSAMIFKCGRGSTSRCSPIPISDPTLPVNYDEATAAWSPKAAPLRCHLGYSILRKTDIIAARRYSSRHTNSTGIMSQQPE